MCVRVLSIACILTNNNKLGNNFAYTGQYYYTGNIFLMLQCITQYK